MEEETRKRPGAEEYLYALIRCASWVSDAYKKLADESRDKTEILKELYLCACDGVPVEKAQGALEKKRSPEKVLHAVRRKYLEESFTTDYEDEIHGIRKKAATLERDVKKMKEEVNDIIERMPTFESAFPERDADKEEPDAKVSVQQGKSMEKPDASDDEGKKEAENQAQAEKAEDVPKFGTNKKAWWKFHWRKPFGVKAKRNYIEHLLQEGYDNAQLSYLLDCLESGMTPDEIERIASPKLPVEIMERLRQMEEKPTYRNSVQAKQKGWKYDKNILPGGGNREKNPVKGKKESVL